MAYKQKLGPLRRAGYDKDATSPFQQDETSGTRIAPGLRDEFGTLVPEGDFTSGPVISGKLPEKTKKVINRFQRNLQAVSMGYGVPDDSKANRFKNAKNPQPSHMADVKYSTIDAFGSPDKWDLKVLKIYHDDAKKHRAKQKN